MSYYIMTKRDRAVKTTAAAAAMTSIEVTQVDVVQARVKERIDNETRGLPFNCFSNLLDMAKGDAKDRANTERPSFSPTREENALTICDYVSSMRSEVNPSSYYRRDIITLLCNLSTFFNNNTAKSFKEITRDDLLSFLDSYRKTEDLDPSHKWIGTYNLFRIHLMRFFKWLYFPDVQPDKRPKPPVIENIPQLKRKEKSIYKPTDLWSAEDDSLFLKYCPNPRDRCYHAMSRDSAARPHELLKLRIKDVVFKLTPDSKKQYAEILVSGKTGTRPIPLIDSIPYIKDWITNHHPQAANSSSILLCGFGKSLNRPIGIITLHKIYQRYKNNFFPKLLNDPNVLLEDKQRISELLKDTLMKDCQKNTRNVLLDSPQ
jgi:integrase